MNETLIKEVLKNSKTIAMIGVSSEKKGEDKNNLKRFDCDAMLTKSEGIVLSVLTADCVPILIYDNNSKIIAAIHAGWKGAYKGIVDRVIKFMVKKGCDRKNIHAAIGPCISQKNYNVESSRQGQ